MLLGIYVDARDEDAVDALEAIERLAPLSPAPDGIAGDPVLPLRENERDVERYAGSGQLLQRIETGRRGGHLDHAVLMAARPLFPQADVGRHALGVRRAELRIF